MKVFGALLCLFISLNAFGQKSVKVHKDTLYVINGQSSANKFNGINSADISSITVLKNAPLKDKHISDSDKVTVIVVTKSFAINEYQKKFSTFSKKYKDHLGHQNNDEDISYVLNGVFLSVKPGERTKELYELSPEKINSVDFIENPYYNGGDSRKYIVVIATKK